MPGASQDLAEAIFGSLYPRRDELVLKLDAIGRTALLGSIGEVPRVEAYFNFVADQVTREVAGILPVGWQCAMSGSFVHGGSKGRYVVRPDAGRACEIGDLLVAVEYDLGGRLARSALLIQAKKGTADPRAPWKSGGKSQRNFLADMPPFSWRDRQDEVPRPGCRRTLKPDLTIECPCGGDWFSHGTREHWSRWFVDDVLPPKYGGAVFSTLRDPPLVVPPAPGYEPRALAAVLVDMLLFMGGWEFKNIYRAYDPDASGQLGWSAVIWDILRQAAVREHSSKTMRGRQADRTPVRFVDEAGFDDTSAFPASFLNELGDDWGRPNDRAGTLAEPEDGGGVSVVRISIRADQPPPAAARESRDALEWLREDGSLE